MASGQDRQFFYSREMDQKMHGYGIKSNKRHDMSSIQLYVHYQKQMTTLHRELAWYLYHGDKRRKRKSVASTPCIALIVAYLQLPVDFVVTYSCTYRHTNSFWTYYVQHRALAPPNLLKRKAIALLDWRVRQCDFSNLASDYLLVSVVPRNSADKRVATIRAGGISNINGPIPIDDLPVYRNGFPIISALRLYGEHYYNKGIYGATTNFQCATDAWIDAAFGMLLTDETSLDNIESITFSSDSVESQVDIPGMVAPVSSCGDIPGVAHFFPHMFAPLHELVVVPFPDEKAWEAHREKRQPSARLATIQDTARETYDAVAHAWDASRRAENTPLDYTIDDFSLFYRSPYLSRKRRKHKPI